MNDRDKGQRVETSRRPADRERSAQAGHTVERKSAGFTLLELLVVIAIIGLMTAVVAVNSNAARVQGRDALRKTDLALVAGALQIYSSEKRSFPLAPLGDWNGPLKAALYPAYANQWPSNPNGTDGTFGTGFVYITNQAIVGPPAGSLWSIDVPLEGKEDPSITAPSDFSCDATQLLYYVTGTMRCPDGKIHDRISSR